MVQPVLPPLMVGFVITFIYITYTVNVVVPDLQLSSSNPNSNEDSGNASPKAIRPTNADQFKSNLSFSNAVASAFIFNLLFFMLLLSFFRSIRTHPGSIPQLPIWKEATFGISSNDEERFRSILNDESSDILQNRDFIINLPVVERKKKDTQYRYCATCEIYKPDRTHHCRICQRCILRMDHHCPWIMNCVGFMNYKFFLLFLIYILACCIHVLVSMFPRLYYAFRPMLDYKYFFARDLPVILSYGSCFVLMFAIGGFLCMHLYLTASAMSTIEYKEKKNVQETKHRFNVAHLKFDKGMYNNLVNVFGPIYMWLLPIQPNAEIEGTYCPQSLQETTFKAWFPPLVPFAPLLTRARYRFFKKCQYTFLFINRIYKFVNEYISVQSFLPLSSPFASSPSRPRILYEIIHRLLSSRNVCSVIYYSTEYLYVKNVSEFE